MGFVNFILVWLMSSVWLLMCTWATGFSLISELISIFFDGETPMPFMARGSHICIYTEAKQLSAAEILTPYCR